MNKCHPWCDPRVFGHSQKRERALSLPLLALVSTFEEPQIIEIMRLNLELLLPGCRINLDRGSHWEGWALNHTHILVTPSPKRVVGFPFSNLANLPSPCGHQILSDLDLPIATFMGLCDKLAALTVQRGQADPCGQIPSLLTWLFRT